MIAATLIVLLGAGGATLPGERSPQALADLIDGALAEQWKAQGIDVAPFADDATWLRRLSIDLCGTIPEREEVAVFLADERTDKRARKIDEYLADRSSAQNLSYLWNNALLAAASMKEPEAMKLRPWLEEQFANNVPFADVTRSLLSATGTNDENGATSFMLAYTDDIESLSSVTARTFLGVQIQCAQCHDHPSDAWKQTDFNGFTGFFLGIRSNRVSEMPPVYKLADSSIEEMRREQRRRMAGVMRKARREARDGQDGEDRMDGAGAMEGGAEPGMTPEDEAFYATLTPPQRERFEKARERQRIYGDARFLDGKEHTDNPQWSRRQALAEWVVDPANPWYSKAVVNRFWSHFFGAGLVHPVDDLTGSKDQVLPQLHDVIAQQFEQSGTDLRFLLSAFARTRAYALANSLERDAEKRAHQERWYAAHPLRPFTAEQVLHSLLRATATEDDKVSRERGEDFEVVRRKLLEKFRYTFDDDEGGDAERFAASIPQALFLMNGRMTNEEITLKKSRMLDEILDESRSDRERLRQIFLATLGRLPMQREAEKLARLVKGASGGGKRGIEDLYWALLNCTEFLTNH